MQDKKVAFSKYTWLRHTTKDYVTRVPKRSVLSASSYGAMPLAEGVIKTKIKREKSGKCRI